MLCGAANNANVCKPLAVAGRPAPDARHCSCVVCACRYKTFLCERGEACDRPICFFAHTPAELRELPKGLQRTQPAPRHAPPEAAAATPGASSSRFPGYHPPSDPGAASSSLPQQGYTSSSSWAYQQQAGQHRGASAGEPQQGLGARQPAQQLPGSPMLAMHPPTGCGSSGMARPEAHRGATVAVIPAGPSVWQNNSLLQSESGEAPNLEELCAAVTRLAMQQADQASDQVAWQQQQQHMQQPSLAAVAAVPAQLPAPVMGLQQGMPDMALLPVYAGHQHQQQPASQQPQQQQVMLPNGQVILVQVPSGSSPAQMTWSSLQPPNG